MTPEAERFNGWAAMLGFVAAVGAYVTTGQIIPGWFQNPFIQNSKIYLSATNVCCNLIDINFISKYPQVF